MKPKTRTAAASTDLLSLCRLIAARNLPVASIAALGLAFAGPAPAATIQVTASAVDNTANGNCSLPEAIVSARDNMAVDACTAGDDLTDDGDVVVLPASSTFTFTKSASQNTVLPSINVSKLTVQGNGSTLIWTPDPTDFSTAYVREFMYVGGSGTVLNVDDLTINGNKRAITARSESTLNVSMSLLSGQSESAIVSAYANVNVSDTTITGAGKFGVKAEGGGNVTIVRSFLTNNGSDPQTQSGGVSTYSPLLIQDTVISGNQGGSPAVFGGYSARVDIKGSTISGNTTRGRGPIFARGGGTLTIHNSTISGNHNVLGTGANAVTAENATTTILHSTITGNTGGNSGLNADSGSTTVSNSIVANNAGVNCSGQVLTLGANLSSDGSCLDFTLPNTDPLLGPLQDNGGLTHTHALLAGSPAIDAVLKEGSVDADQRGIARPQGTASDLGAYELEEVAAEPDSTPDAFSFTDQIIAPGKVATSNTITVSGINQATPISVVNGRYSINGGEYTLQAGTVSNGDTVTLRKGSSAVAGEVTTVTLSIGSVSDAWQVTSRDVVPNAFTFTDQVLDPGKVATSNTITVSGINQAAPISVVNGRYSINGGEYTLQAGTVSNGDTVTLRKASSAVAGEVNTVTLSIGGVSDAWQVATRDAVPDAFTFTDQVGVKGNVNRLSNVITVSGINVPVELTIAGGKYSRNGGSFTSAKTTVSNGDQIRVQVKSSSTEGATVSSILSIGGVSDTFSVTTKVTIEDTQPDAFSFGSVNNAELSSLVTSEPVTISGINVPTSIQISGAEGSYSINGGDFVSSAGTVNNGDTIRIRLTTSSANNTPVTSTLTIGGVQGTFTVTSKIADDTVPDAFSFSNVINASRLALVTSGSVTISGINAPASVQISGHPDLQCHYSINDGAFVSSAGTVNNGDVIRMRLLTSNAYSTTGICTLTIGGVQGPFSVTTQKMPR